MCIERVPPFQENLQLMLSDKLVIKEILWHIQVLLSAVPPSGNVISSEPDNSQLTGEAAAKSAKDEYWRSTCRDQHATWKVLAGNLHVVKAA